MKNKRVLLSVLAAIFFVSPAFAVVESGLGGSKGGAEIHRDINSIHIKHNQRDSQENYSEIQKLKTETSKAGTNKQVNNRIQKLEQQVDFLIEFLDIEDEAKEAASQDK